MEIENEKMFNILEIKHVKTENKFFKKTIEISTDVKKKLKWKKIKMKNKANVATTIENKYETKLFISCLMIMIVQKQRVERSLKNKNKNKNKNKVH